MSRLGDALRRKFKTPQDAIRALGLDSKILDEDIVAGDSKERLNMKTKLTRQGAIATCVLASYLRPKLAQDAKIDLRPIFKGITAKDFKEKKSDLVKAIEKKVNPILAKDATIGEVAELLDMIEAHGVEGEDAEVPESLQKEVGEIGEKFAEPDVMDADPMAKVEEFLKGKLSDEDLAQCLSMLKGGEPGGGDEKGGEEKLKELGAADNQDDLEKKPLGKDEPADREEMAEKIKETEKKGAKDEPPPFKGKPKVGGGMDSEKDMVTKPAMDAAIKAAVESVRKNGHDIREAERAVQPWVGNLTMSFDSGEEVYRQALKMLNVKVDGVHPSAYRTILELQPKPGNRKPGESQIAMDAANTASFHEMFPSAARIGLMG